MAEAEKRFAEAARESSKRVAPGQVEAWAGDRCVFAGPLAELRQCAWPGVDRLVLNPGTLAEIEQRRAKR